MSSYKFGYFELEVAVCDLHGEGICITRILEALQVHLYYAFQFENRVTFRWAWEKIRITMCIATVLMY